MKLALSVLVLAAACGTESTSETESLTRGVGECGPRETHVLGVFEPLVPDGGSGGDDGSGTILIKVDRPGNDSLVFSAHEAGTWKIVTSSGAKVTDVYAVGKYAQRVIAPAGANVMTESDAQGGAMACGFSWPGNATCDTKGLLRLAALRLDKHATSFHGCYKAGNFVIGENLGVRSDCGLNNTSRALFGNQSDIITRCEPDKPESNCDDVVLY